MIEATSADRHGLRWIRILAIAVGAGSTLHADFGPLGAVDVAFA